MTTVLLEGNKMKEIASASHTATVTINALANRQRLRHSSDITRLRSQLVRNGEKIVEVDYMKFWKDLEAANVGSIIYGRKNKPDRFKWFYNLKSVAKSAMEGSDEEAKQISSPKIQFTSPKKRFIRRRAKTNVVVEAKSEHVNEKIILIPLRANYHLEIKVPANVTKEEIKVIVNSLALLG